MERGTCALCKQEKELVESHIFPKFVERYLKGFSKTGRFIDPFNARKKHQSLRKMPLLCVDCDNVTLQSHETYFAEKIFKPYHNNEANEWLGYSDSLLRFIVSISWRYALFEWDLIVRDNPDHEGALKAFLADSREFLLGTSSVIPGCEHHLVFGVNMWHYLNGAICIGDYERYIHSTDAVPVVWGSNDEYLVLMCRLCDIYLFSTLGNQKIDWLEGSKVEMTGDISVTQKVIGNKGLRRAIVGSVCLALGKDFATFMRLLP